MAVAGTIAVAVAGAIAVAVVGTMAMAIAEADGPSCCYAHGTPGGTGRDKTRLDALLS